MFKYEFTEKEIIHIEWALEVARHQYELQIKDASKYTQDRAHVWIKRFTDLLAKMRDDFTCDVNIK